VKNNTDHRVDNLSWKDGTVHDIRRRLRICHEWLDHDERRAQAYKVGLGAETQLLEGQVKTCEAESFLSVFIQ